MINDSPKNVPKKWDIPRKTENSCLENIKYKGHFQKQKRRKLIVTIISKVENNSLHYIVKRGVKIVPFPNIFVIYGKAHIFNCFLLCIFDKGVPLSCKLTC